ncbi:unnamed protein product [Rotaria sp. Silwood1]|nr:unnamed protein product [Rotaria sp. Silwood1]CAF1268872.1 unnamed protein product [Rotaria sp. Silwood1]CAF3481394.1 unnamed protein product [Rotaria sp. Silwood1]CAF4534399.1 unnamed protein product [Rotaria sp. Silwood1]
MTESPLNIPVYEGSMVSLRSPMASAARLRPTIDLVKRKAEPVPKWKRGQLESKYQCLACNNYLKFPIQFEDCGHHVCSSCLPDIMRAAPRCPSCQQPISRDRIVNDKILQKEIQSLNIYCSNQDKGCDWKGILKDFSAHVETCGFVPFECTNGCGGKFERRFMTKHQTEDCPKRKVTCEFCIASIIFEDEIPHLNTCTEFKIPCPNKCSNHEFKRGQMQNHLENECPKQELSCPFIDCGCEYRGQRVNITEHIKESPGLHLNVAGKTIAIQKKLLQAFEERMNEQKKWIELLTKKVNALEKTYGAQYIWKIDHYQERLQDARSNKKTTLFSPPFLTSRHGYRLALAICLDGDGKAKGKYVSLFISICRSDYDALLSWPFSHRVTFTLLDQCEDIDNRRPIVYSVKPNICKENKPFLGRPVTERNASFGAQKFTEVDTMTSFEYIKDDTIFIKVEIDNEEMIII